MTSQDVVEIFERAVTARARILRVEADRSEAAPGLLALTFDVGRVTVRSDGQSLVAETVAERAALPPGLVPLDEEEPWWRVLGQSITAAWPIAGSGEASRPPQLAALKLRFRESDQNPRIVAVEVAGPALRVRLEPS